MKFKVAEIRNLRWDEDGFLASEPEIGPEIETFEVSYPALAIQKVRDTHNPTTWINAGGRVTCAWEDGPRVLCLTVI